VPPDTLATTRLLLRPPEPRDADALYKLVNDWAVVRMLQRLPFPYPRALMDEWIAAAARQRDAGAGYQFIITGRENDEELVIGCIGIRLDLAPRTAHLGYWVGKRFWGHGVATEAAGRAARWALAHLDVERLEAFVAEDNPSSAAVLRRIGFRETGCGRERFLARGAEIPVLRFAATREDFSAKPDPIQPGALRPVLLVAACALIDAEGRVLLARRPEGKPLAGLWEFPGGKLRPGETPEAALIRELREELGIETATSCIAPFAFASHAYERFHLLMPLYVCRRWQGQATGREGQALAWATPARMADYPMPPADKPLVAMLRDLL